MTSIRLDVEGPDFYCPDCHRWLARAKPDGLFDLAPGASMMLHAEVPADLADGVNDVPTLMVEATCHKPLCRFKRWLRGI